MALPVASCGLRLENESIRVALGLRLGCVLCSAHRCSCGAIVSDRGVHGLSCRLAVGRLVRHNAINDIIYRALGRAGVPSVLEPRGLKSSDDRRPHGLTMIPCSEGHCLGWDATVYDSLTESHLNRTVHAALAAAELTADAKNRKYADLLGYHFGAGKLLSRHWTLFAPMAPNSSRSSSGSRPSPAIRATPRFCFNGLPSRFREAMLQPLYTHISVVAAILVPLSLVSDSD